MPKKKVKRKRMKTMLGFCANVRTGWAMKIKSNRIRYMSFSLIRYVLFWGFVLVQRELDKSLLQLRDNLAFGKEVFLGIAKL